MTLQDEEAQIGAPAPELKTAAANGSASQDLDEVVIASLRLIVSTGQAYALSVQQCPERTRAP